MAITERRMDATPEGVFGALLDPYLYKHWVVGSKDIRGADDDWPAIGSAFYHRLGAGEAEIKDKTEILELEVPHRIALRTFARPLGIARVVISARPAGDQAIVSIFEEPEEGTKMRAVVRLVDPIVHVRNIESLRRLERVVQIRASAVRDSSVDVPAGSAG